MSALTFWGPRAPFAPFGFTDPAALLRRFGTPTRAAESAWYVPAADVVREGDDAVVRLELPGVDVASDVTVEVVGHRLVVRGERRDEHTGEGFRETRRGSFRRSFSLPQHVGPEAVSASYDAGVLSVRVSGVHAEPESQRIAISGVASDEAAPAEGTEGPSEGSEA
ncbi:Hsp20/alpha crystallin family protein [Actinomycetospora sp. TBRC 11914]|uniref:Hsp20/alpha crystallin family protein n=1 Tax=Actinomycetospora sp. TBRC 11914 TaxID=2729387 RepID=UPI00145D7125|nr:Hsp20/alpha crystallin family protein [Actinomycetospora sp. TBRC 11914]NMO93632.1 Hsp20/alpha crystallin family protein [Actinomycetospora sp. TBRC 11914]